MAAVFSSWIYLELDFNSCLTDCESSHFQLKNTRAFQKPLYTSRVQYIDSKSTHSRLPFLSYTFLFESRFLQDSPSRNLVRVGTLQYEAPN